MRMQFSKIALTVGLIACFSITGFAQEEQKQPVQQQQSQNIKKDKKKQEKVRQLVKGGVEKNKEEIQQEVSYLSETDREYLYKKNAKHAFFFGLLNAVPGFGMGSYLQGDTKAGLVQSAVDIAAYISLFYTISSTSAIHNCYSYDSDYEACEAKNKDAKNTVIRNEMIVVTLWSANRIAAWIFPIIYKKKYNKKLKEAFGLSDVSYSIDPLIVPKDGMPAVGLAFNLRY